MLTAETRAATVAGVPAVLWYRGSPETAAQCGTVLMYHGFGGSKEGLHDYLEPLAQAGLLAVSLDAVGHGDRRYPDFDVRFSDERWDQQFDATESDFLTVIDQTAAGVPVIIDELLARNLARPDGIGVGGRSLGGNVAYAAILADRRVRAAVSVVGSPEWTLPRAHSPHRYPERFFPAAIMSQAAEFDEHSPADQIRAFHARLEPCYASEPDRALFVEYPGAGHFLTPELNADSRQRLVGWFSRWLAAGPA